nr:hypothetical protein [Pseudomonas sp. BIGb0427]
MRVFVLFAGLCHSLLALADVAPADYQTPPAGVPNAWAGCSSMCPRTLPGTLPVATGSTTISELPDPTITPGEQQIAYGDGLTPKQRYLVDIEVSPLTTRELFEQIRYSQTLNVEPAQQRVVKAEIKALDAVISATRSDDSGYRALLDQSIELDEKLERIGYVHSQLILLDDLIRQFTAEGRSVAKAQAERDAFFKEQAQWPTDVEFEHERSIELGLPDAFANWYEGKLVAYLWRNQRIYRFNFHSGATTATASAALALLEPRARAVLAAFRTRKQYETPQENGFCVPYGFIADDGAPRHAITLGFTPADNPKLLHRLSMSNDDEKSRRHGPDAAGSTDCQPVSAADQRR